MQGSPFRLFHVAYTIFAKQVLGL